MAKTKKKLTEKAQAQEKWKIKVSQPQGDDAGAFIVPVNGTNYMLRYDTEEIVPAEVYHALNDATVAGCKKAQDTDKDGNIQWVMKPTVKQRYIMVGTKI